MRAVLREIEVKAYITSIQDIKDKLLSLGCVFTNPITQLDQIFFEKGTTITSFKPGLIGIRIRTEGENILLTVKKRTDIPMSAIEKELKIEDAGSMKEILELLSYKETLCIHKVRVQTRYNDYTICLDTVDELGSFIEVEKITLEDSKKVQKELHKFLSSLGIKKEQLVMHPYDELLLRKRS